MVARDSVVIIVVDSLLETSMVSFYRPCASLDIVVRIAKGEKVPTWVHIRQYRDSARNIGFRKGRSVMKAISEYLGFAKNCCDDASMNSALAYPANQPSPGCKILYFFFRGW